MVQQTVPPPEQETLVDDNPIVHAEPEVTETPASVVETPVAPVDVQPSPKVQQTIPPEIQEYIARVEDQNRTIQGQQDENDLRTFVGQYAQRLQQQYGLTPEQAVELASTQGRIVKQQYDAERFRTGQVRAAIAIAKELNVDPVQLMDLPSPQAMRETARTLSAGSRQAAENAQLKARIAALEKGQVPSQRFSQGAQPGAGAGLTGDALESAWLKHEVEQSDKPNPYDSAYRLMLRG